MNQSQTQKILADALRQANAEKAAAFTRFKRCEAISHELQSNILLQSMPEYSEMRAYWRQELSRAIGDINHAEKAISYLESIIEALKAPSTDKSEM